MIESIYLTLNDAFNKYEDKPFTLDWVGKLEEFDEPPLFYNISDITTVIETFGNRTSLYLFWFAVEKIIEIHDFLANKSDAGRYFIGITLSKGDGLVDSEHEVMRPCLLLIPDSKLSEWCFNLHDPYSDTAKSVELYLKDIPNGDMFTVVEDDLHTSDDTGEGRIYVVLKKEYGKVLTCR